MENQWYLFSAYLIIWLALWGYTIRMSIRQKRLSHEITSLKDQLSHDNRRG